MEHLLREIANVKRARQDEAEEQDKAEEPAKRARQDEAKKPAKRARQDEAKKPAKRARQDEAEEPAKVSPQKWVLMGELPDDLQHNNGVTDLGTNVGHRQFLLQMGPEGVCKLLGLGDQKTAMDVSKSTWESHGYCIMPIPASVLAGIPASGLAGIPAILGKPKRFIFNYKKEGLVGYTVCTEVDVLPRQQKGCCTYWTEGGHGPPRDGEDFFVFFRSISVQHIGSRLNIKYTQHIGEVADPQKTQRSQVDGWCFVRLSDFCAHSHTERKRFEVMYNLSRLNVI